MNPETKLIVVALLESNEPRGGETTFVLTRRAKDTHLGGFWEFPGGKVEPGEGPVTALRRELQEELGVLIEGIEPTVFSYHEYPERHVLILFYKARVTTMSPRPEPLAASELRFMTLEEVLELEMPPANEPFLHFLLANARR